MYEDLKYKQQFVEVICLKMCQNVSVRRRFIYPIVFPQAKKIYS